jgi:hypothetical protein
MIKMKMRVWAMGIVSVTLLTPTSFLEAQTQLRGQLFNSFGGAGTEYIIKIVIDNYSTAEEILSLKRSMASGNIKDFYEALRALNKGRMDSPKAGTNIRFNIAFRQPTEKGFRILLVTESRIVRQGESYGGPYYYLVVELDLNKNYEGDGKVHYAARIAFPANGGIDLESYATAPDLINFVHLVK